MAKHTHSSQLARLYGGELPPEEAARLLEETAQCEECVRQSRDAASIFTSADDIVATFAEDDHPSFEELERHADGAVDAVLSAHVASCALCAAHVRDLRAIGDSQKGKVIAFRPRWLAAAAAIVAAVIAAALYFRPADSSQMAKTKPPVAPPAVTATSTTVAPAPNRIEIADGARRLTVDAEGRVLFDGVELAANDAADVRALLEGKLPRVADTSSLRTAEVTLLGDDDVRAPAALRYPVAETAPTAAPEIRWTAVKEAKSYQVQVTDLDFNVVFDKVVSDTKTVAENLQPGRTYQWQVVTNFADEQTSNSPIAKFRVASRSEQEEIERVRGTDSVFLLGLQYLRIGAVTPAQQQFAAVEKQNPQLDLPEVGQPRSGDFR